MNKTSASEVCSLNQPDTKGMHNFTLRPCLNCLSWYHRYGHSNESELLLIRTCQKGYKGYKNKALYIAIAVFLPAQLNLLVKDKYAQG